MKITTPADAKAHLHQHALGAEGAVFLNEHEQVLATQTMTLDPDRLTKRASELGACALIVFQKRSRDVEQSVLAHLESRRVKRALAPSSLRVMDWFHIDGAVFHSLAKDGLV